MATDFDRNDRLQGLLRETLRSQTASGPCPDAATLAAWTEGGLTAEETAAIDAHLGSCARCRELAATLSMMPETEAAPATAVVPFTPRANGRWKVIVGAMGAVAASALIWVAVRDEAPRLDTRSASNQAQQSRPLTAGDRAPAAEPESPAPRRNESANALLGRQAQQGQIASATPRPESKLAEENRARAAELSRRGLIPSATPAALPVQRTEPPPPAVMPPPPPAATAPPPPAPAPTTTAATAGAARSSTVTGLPQSSLTISLDNTKPTDPARASETFFSIPIIAEFVVGADLLAQQGQGFGATADTFRAGGAGRGGGGGGGRGSAATGSSAAAAQKATVAEAALRVPVRWRLRAASTATAAAAERSNDGGLTWQRVEIPATPTLSSGSAPTNTVCWLVGRAGTVLLSTDGNTFRQVTKPTDADLVSVRATDARSATVRTADGQTFMTNDGGTTWTLR